MCSGRRSSPSYLRSSACTRHWGAAGSRRWRSRSMLFKPDLNETAKAGRDGVVRVASRARRRIVSITITLLILGGLGYIAWTSLQQKQAANRNARPDLPVPVLAATPQIKDVPVYLDGVGAVRALNTVTVRSQVDGKLIAVNFVEGQDVKKGDVVGEIDPVIYMAQYDQAVAKKAQDEAQLANQRLDLIRYQQLAASNAGSKQQADTQRAVVAQQEALVNAASAKGALTVDVFGNDGVTVIDTGTLKGIDNQVDQTTGTLKLKAEFPNASFQLWPGQFVNVRLKVDTLSQAVVVPTSAVQRGPAGTFSYVIGEGDIVTAKPVVLTQQNETDAVIASGLSPSDRVVTTGFANLSDGAKVIIGKEEQTPAADLAPRKKGSRGAQGKDGQAKDGQSKDGQGERRSKKGERAQAEGDQKGQTGPAQGSDQSEIGR